jgi:PTH1 family peptidyl-tRNA hydrolase
MDERGIKLIAGLGNPGPQYEWSRHNVGYWLVDALAEHNSGRFRLESKLQGLLCRLFVSGRSLRLLKPTTFMNRSGQSLGAVIRYFDITPDQVPVGTARLKWGGGHAGHKGLRDIIDVLGTRDFWRLRIGIDHPQDRSQVVSYVLHRASMEDEKRIREALGRAELCLADVLEGEFQMAMNRLHREV